MGMGTSGAIRIWRNSTAHRPSRSLTWRSDDCLAAFDVSQAPNGVNFLAHLQSLAASQASVSLVRRLGIANDYLHARKIRRDTSAFQRIIAHLLQAQPPKAQPT
ncbi:hypothetical protein CERZMDRAFT_94542 [Cercospora zeae-maydis SCOH1-5]|uniref:Uncharacterized protein n=1 Tax=Cercospora zeae-maydis SCOH1-5 TaxID=717836 RepID=A0A6A6FNZ7_9PEZI|nr:hypothetical protein CERZMDRAFT_94542 [Cercospora zeae-maydis SCOH1-5]